MYFSFHKNIINVIFTDQGLFKTELVSVVQNKYNQYNHRRCLSLQ